MATLYIDGIDLWTPELPGWDAAQAALRGDAPPDAPPDTPAAPPPSRPMPSLLAGNERRRAPDSVLVALQVAQAAVAMSGHDAATLPSVFTSAHGDLAIVDALCRTLASDPLLLSPTRFHHSVHNAASGYWAMATGCRAASSAVSAFTRSFAAGWLESASLCLAEDAPVLLVGFDTEARGALASVNRSRGLLGVALVLSPRRGLQSRWRVEAVLDAAATWPAALHSPAANALAANAMADALPLFEALAAGRPAHVDLPLGPSQGWRLALTPCDAPPAAAAPGAEA